MPQPFDASIPLKQLYLQYYQPAKHPGDEHRDTRWTYELELDKFDRFFRFAIWRATVIVAPRRSVKELYLDFEKWLEQAPDRLPAVRLCDCSDELVVGAMNWLVELGRARTTANKLRRHVNAVWKFGARKLKLPPPDNEKYRENLAAPVALLQSELKLVLKAAARVPGNVGELDAGVWWQAAILFLYSSGLRIRQAFAVPTKDLDLLSGKFLAPADEAKGRKAQRLDLHASTVKALRVLRLHERRVPLVFGDWPFKIRAARERYKWILVDAGLFPDIKSVPRELLFHGLRKTLGSQIIATKGLGAAQRRLGHASPETTKRYGDARYTDDEPIESLAPDPIDGDKLPTEEPWEPRIADCG